MILFISKIKNIKKWWLPNIPNLPCDCLPNDKLSGRMVCRCHMAGSGTILKSQLADAFVRQLSMTEREAKVPEKSKKLPRRSGDSGVLVLFSFLIFASLIWVYFVINLFFVSSCGMISYLPSRYQTESTFLQHMKNVKEFFLLCANRTSASVCFWWMLFKWVFYGVNIGSKVLWPKVCYFSTQGYARGIAWRVDVKLTFFRRSLTSWTYQGTRRLNTATLAPVTSCDSEIWNSSTWEESWNCFNTTLSNKRLKRENQENYEGYEQISRDFFKMSEWRSYLQVVFHAKLTMGRKSTATHRLKFWIDFLVFAVRSFCCWSLLTTPASLEVWLKPERLQMSTVHKQ